MTDTLTISWTGADGDGDLLSYLVRYSADGGATWQVVANDVYTTSLVVDASLLPGSDGASLVQVLASDGFYTAADQSNAPFSLERHAPLVHIQKPLDGAIFDTGAPIALKGQAHDPEDGHLTGDSLTWTVAGYGSPGNGEETTRFGLPAGSYAVTLTATDSDGDSASTAVTIAVVPGGQQAVPENAIYLPLIIR